MARLCYPTGSPPWNPGMDLTGAPAAPGYRAHPSPQIMPATPWVGALLLCLSKLYSSNAPEIPNPITVWALHPVWVRATQGAPAPP